MATPPLPLPRPERPLMAPPLPKPRPEMERPLTALELYRQRRSGLTRTADATLRALATEVADTPAQAEEREARADYRRSSLLGSFYMIPTSIGIGKMGGNLAALARLIPQKDVDEFFVEADKEFGDVKVAMMGGNERAREDFDISQGVGEMGAFVIPALGLARIISATTTAGPLLATASADAFLAFGAISPDDQNLFNLIKDISESDDPGDQALLYEISNILATDKDDGEFTNRARNVAEALTFYLPVQRTMSFFNKARSSITQGKEKLGGTTSWRS